MADELKSLNQVFDGSLFRIPDYQRGYAWQEGKQGQKSQLGEFWDDLVNLAEGKGHYTGLLTLNELSAEEAEKILDENSKGTDKTVYEIVDGQQRLTTAIILIQVLLERFCGDEETDDAKKTERKNFFQEKLDNDLDDIAKKFIRVKRHGKGGVYSYIFGYAKDDPSYNCLRYKIFGEKNEPAMGTTPDTYYTKNLEQAKIFFQKKVDKLIDDAAVEIYKKLVNRLKFNIHKIGNDFDVFVSFETMNNRGKPLSNLELLKNRLIYLSVLFKDDNLRRTITDAWKEIYKRLGQNKDELIADDEYLRAHWITYFGAPNKKQREDITSLMKIFSPQRIKGFISTNDTHAQQNLTADKVKEYVESLSKFAKYYVFTHFPNTKDDANNLTAEEKFYLFLLKRLGVRYFRPLLMVACSKEPSPARLEMFKSIERFIFVNFILRRYRSDKDQTTYYNFAGELNNAEVSFAYIKKSLDESVALETDGACKSFENEISENFRRGNGFYDWGTLRYFLLVYESFLSKKSGRYSPEKLGEAMENYAAKNTTIEHIFPEEPDAVSDWKKKFAACSNAEQKILKNALGNFLLLPGDVNSSLKGASFDIKKKADNARKWPGYSQGACSEGEVAEKKQWTATEILERSKKLVDFMDERWSLNLSDAQKKSLIHLDFVK